MFYRSADGSHATARPDRHTEDGFEQAPILPPCPATLFPLGRDLPRTLSLSDTHRLRGRPVLRVRIGRPLRLLRGIRQMLVEPRGVSTKIKLARPFEAAPALANTDLREERRIVEGGKDALADQ